MKAKSLVSGIAVFAMLFLNVAPAFALGELPTPTVTPIPAVDLCPNIDDAQALVPTDMIIDGSGNCVNLIPADTTPPVISGVANASVLSTVATIAWTTNELTTSTLEYGATTGYGSSATLDTTALLAHDAIILNLTPSTTYHYCIHATDLAGNTANSCGHSFTTAANSNSGPIDMTPPDITLITVTPITTTSATINFTTNEIGNAEIQYGTTAGYGTTTPLDTNLALTHATTLSNLSPSTTYHYRIKTSDEIENQTVSGDETFTTLAPEVQNSGAPAPTPESPAPQMQAPVSSVTISAIETASITTAGATITWHTDVPSDSQLEYGNSENLGSLTTLDTTMATSHSVSLTGLSPNTNYLFKVKSKPVGASMQTVSTNQEFDTLAVSVPIVPPANVSLIASGAITTGGATITWATDKAATSQVEYGINTSYGQTSAANNTLTLSHSITLAGLDSDTLYHFRVKSIDSADNVTFSEDHTFTTSKETATSGYISSQFNVPPAVTTLAIGGYDKNSVALEWHAASATSDATQEYDVRYGTLPITQLNFAANVRAQTTPIFYSDTSPQSTLRTYIVSGLDPNSQYYFAITSKHETSDFAEISNVVSITTTYSDSVDNETPVSNQGAGSSGGGGSSIVSQEYGLGVGGNMSGSFEPTLVKAEGADSQIIFTWKNPGEANFVRTIVVRKEGSYPSNPYDGQTIYEGRAQTFTDINIQNGKTYYYAFYSYNHAKTYSNGVKVSLAGNAQNTEVKFNESGVESPVMAIEHFTKIFKRGDNDIEIEHLQEVLAADGDSYAQKYITGYFGSLTESALKNFQVKHGLAQTGIVDVPTQQALNAVSQEVKLDIPGDYAVFTNDMKLGDESDIVSDLQAYLIYEGSLSPEHDNGYFGPNTKAAVKAFQKKYGINPISGYVGYKTRHKMKELAGL